MSSAISIEKLTVSYQSKPILWQIDCSLPAEKRIGILGPNGAGKTTLLKTILGIIKPSQGRIRFFGQPLDKLRQQVAYIPQHSSVDWNFPATALDVVLMGRYVHLPFGCYPQKEDRQIAQAAIEQVGLASFSQQRINKLSGGQRQRLFLARALAQQPKIYLLDEPFANVDNKSEKELIEVLNALHSQGKTICLVHHQLATVSKYFDWLLLLNSSLIAAGPTEEVFTSEMVAKTYGDMILEQAYLRCAAGH